MTKLSDQWQTPQWLFDELDAEFHFDIDLCATKDNSKCGVSFCEDYLNGVMSKVGGTNASLPYLVSVGDIRTAFCNPPYSNPRPFIEKAWDDSRFCKIVCLVKCDPSTRWWATFFNYTEHYECRICGDYNTTKDHDCHPYKTPTRNLQHIKRGPKPSCEVRFFPKRIKFDPPKGFGGQTSGPSFASALLIFDRRGL